ncbi:hypothetical protein HN371_10905 [Candidatus Poribacteria bacterium]|jgi:catechol 2,3-dioxygenase-like lactoylglutathione lyase family enzyme|nr:hypothetical protein [Candidatus Poribacteria bacterium]MBT5536701.1 hypothetical protein [Candidatus Poribacteria bacterium]MBT5714876.1 hypothetical protein [Candidatus Poribacteria bacterium]MBT7100398.1 hypothetical protein [Candidatus Poribacteria bacterium]MBT7809377.1 hypothetical protein [Candidatus Poribacteria bacterium]
MQIRGVDYVQYDVADLATSVAFYRGTLGIELTFRKDDRGWAELTAGNVTIALCGGEAEAVSAPGSG